MKKTKSKTKPKRIDSPSPKASENVKKSVKKEQPVDRINVNFEDEIIFVLDKINDSKEKRVLVSIPSGSDLLVSTVSLELLAEAADKKGKNIVVVTDDESGKSLARSVGITVRGAVNSVDTVAWKEADIAAENREEEVKVRREKASEIDETELIPSGAQSERGPARFGPGEDEMVSVGSQLKRDPAMSIKSGEEMSGVSSEFQNDTLQVGSNLHSGVKKVKVGSIEMTVDSSPVGKDGEVDEMGDQIKAEVLKPMSKSLGGSGFIGRDFSNFKLHGLDKKEKDQIEKSAKGGSAFGGDKDKSIIKPLGAVKPSKTKSEPKSSPLSPLKPLRPKKKLNMSFIKNFFVGKSKKKMIAIIVAVVLLLFATSTYAASRYLPEVVVTLEVDSISVEYTGEITADVNEEDIDEDDLVIPAKTEEVEKNGSDTAGTTGIEYEGEKATGSVLVFNKSIEDEVVLNTGTILSNGGNNYIMQNSVVLDAVSLANPATMGEADVIAQEIGDQYNVVAGTQFTVTGYNLGDVYATNTDAFTGGSEEELKVVAQSDIDGLVETLQDTLGKEAVNNLNSKTDNSRWTIVTESIAHELVDGITASAPAGAEANSVDVSLEIVSKALYYDKTKLDELIEALLLEEYDDQIEAFELSDNVEQTITVKSYDLDSGTVTLTVEVSGYVMPQLNEGEITRSLSGQSWTDGIKYLEEMDYVSDEYELDFSPEWMPEILWRMPVSEDRITVEVDNITPEDKEGKLQIVDPDEEGEED